MAFPSIVTRGEGSIVASDTVVNLNTFSPSAGDLLLGFCAYNADPGALNFGSTGFVAHSGGATVAQVYWKIADGSEGASVSFTTANNQRNAHISYRISGHGVSSEADIEISTAATGTSTTPNPGSVTLPSTQDWLFLAWFRLAGEELDDDTWCNSGPTNYTFTSATNGYQKSTGTAGAASANCSIAAAERTLNTAGPEDPGTFSVDLSLAWTAFTVAIPPAAPAVPARIWPQRNVPTITNQARNRGSLW